MAKAQKKAVLLPGIVILLIGSLGSAATLAQDLIPSMYTHGPDVRHITIHPALLGAWLIVGLLCVLAGLRRLASRPADKSLPVGSGRLLFIGTIVIVVSLASPTILDWLFNLLRQVDLFS